MDALSRIQTPAHHLSVEYHMRSYGVGEVEAMRMVETQKQEQFFANSEYVVTVSPIIRRRDWPDSVHIAILRHDGLPIHNWADFQEVKNQVVGESNEAIEIYPAEERLVDMGHQYHLWAFVDPTQRVPLGWGKRMVRT